MPWPRPGGWSAGCATRSPWCAASRPTSCRATPRERAAVAQLLGYPPAESEQMVNDYLRTTRRAHEVVERVFWDEPK